MLKELIAKRGKSKGTLSNVGDEISLCAGTADLDLAVDPDNPIWVFHPDTGLIDALSGSRPYTGTGTTIRVEGVGFNRGVYYAPVVQTVNRELGTTLVVITHNPAIAAMADRVMTMADGRIVEDRRNATRVSVEKISW